MRQTGLLICLLWATWTGGCSSTALAPDIHASDYNQSCTADTDCVLIDEGSSCCTACGNAAINKSDQAKYQAAAQQRQNTCIKTACPAIACISSSAYCGAGKCASCSNPRGCSAQDGGTRD